MPIGLEQWRAQIGLFYASRMPRALVASKGAKYQRMHWALQLLYLCLALVQLLLQTIDSGQQKLKKSVREWTAQLNTSSVFQCMPTYGNGGKKGLSLLATCLIVVQILLLIAGDVERNPGPLTGQGAMASAKKTHEYRTIAKQFSTIVESLSTLVDPTNFAQKLHEAEVITASVVEKASVTGGPTPTERIRPIIQAVQSQVCLKATKYHDFITVLQDACPTLAEVLQKFFTKNVELNAPSVLLKVSDWKTLGTHLNINPGKLNELEQSGDSQYCIEELVREWAKTDSRASWQKLSRALDQMGEKELAERVRDTYITDSGQEATSSGCSERQKHDVEVLGEIRSFESRFENLTFAIREEMEEAHVSPKRFQHFVTLLPMSIRTEHLRFLRESLSDINKAGSIGELFSHLNLYWTFFDYALLEHIIERFGSDQLKKKMAEYVRDLAQFRRTTTLGQFIKYLPESAEPPPHFSEVTVHLTKNAMEYTLEEVERLRRDICIECRFESFVLKLAKVKQSSIIIVWHIPSVLVSDLSDAILDTHSSFFEYHGIVEIEVDGVCVLDIQQKDVEMEDYEQQKLSSKHVKRKRKALEPKLEEMEWHPQLKKLKREQEWKEAAQDVNTELGHQLPKPRDDEVPLEELQMETGVLEKEEQAQRIQEKPDSFSQKLMEEVQDMKAVIEHKEKQLQWERREKEKQKEILEGESENEELGEKLQPSPATDQYERQLMHAKEMPLDPMARSMHLRFLKRMWQQELFVERLLAITTHEKGSHQLPQPEFVFLYHITISDLQADVLAENLRVNTTTNRFRLCNTVISDVGFSAIASALRDNKSLTNMELWDVIISDVGWSSFANALRDNKTLTYLFLQRTTISDSGISALGSALQENKTLKTLQVDFQSVSDRGAREFSDKMEGSSLKKLLILSVVHISEEIKKVLRETARRKGIILTID